MKVGDLVLWPRDFPRDDRRPVIIIEEGPAASSGMMWIILDAGNLKPVFEDDLGVIDASR